MSEEEVPAGPPAWSGGAGSYDPWGGAGWSSAPPPMPGWWPQTFYTYEPPPPRRTSRLLMLGVAVVIFVFAASAAATAVIATRWISAREARPESRLRSLTSTRRSAMARPRRAPASSSRPPASSSPTSTWSTVAGDQCPAHVDRRDLSRDRDRRRHDHDVAVLQIQGGSGFATAPIGNSSNVHIGDSVTALGNAEGRGGSPAVANGQVTALQQTITASDETGDSTETLNGMIQTNAPIQPGDSGGPLINGSGQVIGMDTAASGGRRGPQRGAVESFAIPINTALNYAHHTPGASNRAAGGRASRGVPHGQHVASGRPRHCGMRDRERGGERKPRRARGALSRGRHHGPRR